MSDNSDAPEETRIGLLEDTDQPHSPKKKKKQKSLVVRGLSCCVTTTKYTYRFCECLITWRWLIIISALLIIFLYLYVDNIYAIRSLIDYYRKKEDHSFWGKMKSAWNG